MRSTIVAAFGLFAALAVCNAAPSGAAPVAATAAPESAVRLPLTIRTAHGTRAFRVEVARSEAEQARGLMFRETLAPDAGMIFPFAPPRPASFWMKNTIIPLDMIFIRADGTIARVAANAVPYSLAPVDSGEPVAAVLEIAGGRAAALGIAAGDRVKWRG